MARYTKTYFNPALPYVAEVEVGTTYHELPLLHASCISADSPEKVQAILAEYGVTENDAYVIIHRCGGQYQSLPHYGELDVVESAGFAAQIDAMAKFPTSVAAFFRAWQKLFRSTKPVVWDLGTNGKLTLRLREIPYHKLISLVDRWEGRQSDLIAAGVVVTWTPADGEEYHFNPYDYQSANGSRRRKAFDDIANYRGFAAAWQKLRANSWRHHPLDEMLDRILDLTCRLPELKLAPAPKGVADAVKALRQPRKGLGGAYRIYYAGKRKGEDISNDRHAYWNCPDETEITHDDPEALARVAELIGRQSWFVLDRFERVVSMSEESLDYWRKEQTGWGSPGECENLNRFLYALPTRHYVLPELSKGGAKVKLALSPVGAVLVKGGVAARARVVLTQDEKLLCDIVTHSTREIFEKLRADHGPLLGDDWSYAYSKALSMISERLKDLAKIPRLFEEHVASDAALSAQCEAVHQGLVDLLGWAGPGATPVKDKHQPGCRNLKVYDNAVLGMLQRRYAPEEHEYIFVDYYKKIASCECRLLAWLEKQARSTAPTPAAYGGSAS